MFPYYSMRHGDIIVSSSCPIKWATVTQMLIWIRIPLLQNHNWQLCSQVISIYRQDMVIATRFSNEVRSACKYLLHADALYVPWLVESIFWGIHTKSLSWPRTPCIQYMMKYDTSWPETMVCVAEWHLLPHWTADLICPLDPVTGWKWLFDVHCSGDWLHCPSCIKSGLGALWLGTCEEVLGLCTRQELFVSAWTSVMFDTLILLCQPGHCEESDIPYGFLWCEYCEVHNDSWLEVFSIWSLEVCML